MKSWLYPGAKVVCVDARRSRHSFLNPIRPECALEQGATYTVTSVGERTNAAGSHVVVHLAEIANIKPAGDLGYAACRFRPVLPDTTKQVEEMKRLMRDHVANASGGMGIRKRERA